MILDKAGNLYGTTGQGDADEEGIAFELSPGSTGVWTLKGLHRFEYGGTDGNIPLAGLVFDGSGNLYGTTEVGGVYGAGTVFELTAKTDGDWSEKILHSFDSDGRDGGYSYAGLILDSAGNLFGTTVGGESGGGTVFEIER